ncbi:MAG: hypothetical protein IMF11_01645 [Proteobacteria bacterium]|nr:hypothetical protein [Pseudomonadota bacterium]
MAEKVLLRKYANRRLFDTEKSAYVTLSQVADMIKKRREVEALGLQGIEHSSCFRCVKKPERRHPVIILYNWVPFSINIRRPGH